MLVGVFGAVIELLMIPIVRLLTGEVEENRALARRVPPASSPLSRARAATPRARTPRRPAGTTIAGRTPVARRRAGLTAPSATDPPAGSAVVLAPPRAVT